MIHNLHHWINEKQGLFASSSNSTDYVAYISSLITLGQFQDAKEYILGVNMPEFHNENRYLRALLSLHEKQPYSTFLEDYVFGFSLGLRHPIWMKDIPYAKIWDGKLTQINQLLLIADQGLGDQIRLAHHLTMLEKQAFSITALVHPKILELFQDNFPTIAFQALEDATQNIQSLINTADYLCAFSDLDHLFKEMHESRPTNILTTNTRSDSLNDRNLLNKDKIKIGICYRSSLQNSLRNVHYIDYPTCIEKLMSIVQDKTHKPIEWVSLQCDEDLTQAHNLELRHNISVKRCKNLDLYNDIYGLCDFIGSLDLVISATGYIADIASAMNVPTYRFQTSATCDLGSHDPFYDKNTKIYSRNFANSWNDVLTAVATDSLLFIDNKGKG